MFQMRKLRAKGVTGSWNTKLELEPVLPLSGHWFSLCHQSPALLISQRAPDTVAELTLGAQQTPMIIFLRTEFTQVFGKQCISTTLLTLKFNIVGSAWGGSLIHNCESPDISIQIYSFHILTFYNEVHKGYPKS